VICNIDLSSYKIMRSLYDPSVTPNLPDDILQLQRDGGGQSQVLVTIELACRTSDSQIIIREIIEDNLLNDGVFIRAIRTIQRWITILCVRGERDHSRDCITCIAADLNKCVSTTYRD